MQINPQTIIDSKILIPSEFTKMSQVGIDLSIAEVTKVAHGQSRAVLLNEVVALPKDVFATFIHRSSFNRRGILIIGSIYDPNYSGKVGCTIYNLSGDTIVIYANERIGQMVFFKADAASNYNGQYQNEHLRKDGK